jgi:hypothetical protein
LGWDGSLTNFKKLILLLIKIVIIIFNIIINIIVIENNNNKKLYLDGLINQIKPIVFQVWNERV